MRFATSALAPGATSRPHGRRSRTRYDRDKYIEIQKTALAGLDIELDRLGYRPPPVINLNALPPRQPSRPPVVRHLGALLTIRSLDASSASCRASRPRARSILLGDRVNPRGARYSLPLPLLLHHDHQSPVGEVVAARSTDDGIEITAQIARLSNDGDVKRMCDRAWDLVRSKLVKGLSIGFKAIEREVMPDGGYYFKSWQWLELSLVDSCSAADGANHRDARRMTLDLTLAPDQAELRWEWPDSSRVPEPIRRRIEAMHAEPQHQARLETENAELRSANARLEQQIARQDQRLARLERGITMLRVELYGGTVKQLRDAGIT